VATSPATTSTPSNPRRRARPRACWPCDEALDRLAAIEPRAAEVVKLRYFAGLSVAEAAAALGISPRTADGDWAYARAWLVTALRDGD
jgi:DNA-directed RNA polymerase specialized sigma24 family protein